jgi:hypothetical protein
MHPSHARNTKNIMVGLGIVAISDWAIGMVFGQHDRNPEIINLCVLFCITSGFGLLIIALLRAFSIQCPTCKKLLYKKVPANISSETRKFFCKRCNVIWDSKVQYEFGGE